MTARRPVVEGLAVAVAARLPVALVGPPGVGKTSMVEQLGAAQGAHVEVMVVAQSEPTDLTGIPFVDSEGVCRTAMPDWLDRANALNPSIVFLDELTQASTLHQGVCNDIIQSRRVGARPVAEHVRFVAGYNPPELCGGFDLTLPTRNRFIHVQVSPDPDVVAEGLVAGWPAPPTIAFQELDSQITYWRRIVAAFVKARPSCVTSIPAAGSTGGFPSPRSLEMAAEAAAHAQAAGVSIEARNLLVEGALGPAAGHELIAYASELDLPDPEEALASPAEIDLPSRPDRAWATMQAIADRACREGTIDAWRAAWTVAGRIAKQCGADVAATAVRQLVVRQPLDATPPAEMALFRDLLAA